MPCIVVMDGGTASISTSGFGEFKRTNLNEFFFYQIDLYMYLYQIILLFSSVNTVAKYDSYIPTSVQLSSAPYLSMNN